jgi:hypothetical protein
LNVVNSESNGLSSTPQESAFIKPATSKALQALSGDKPSLVEMADSSDRDDEIFDSPLVQSIRQKHATIEKISEYVWEDMENQDPEDVF